MFSQSRIACNVILSAQHPRNKRHLRNLKNFGKFSKSNSHGIRPIFFYRRIQLDLLNHFQIFNYKIRKTRKVINPPNSGIQPKHEVRDPPNDRPWSASGPIGFGPGIFE